MDWSQISLVSSGFRLGSRLSSPLLAQSGHALVQCKSPLLTHSGHYISLHPFKRIDYGGTIIQLTRGGAMRQREFILLLGNTAVTWPLAVHAQE
jgi:hypothetical protein